MRFFQDKVWTAAPESRSFGVRLFSPFWVTFQLKTPRNSLAPLENLIIFRKFGTFRSVFFALGRFVVAFCLEKLFRHVERQNICKQLFFLERLPRYSMIYNRLEGCHAGQRHTCFAVDPEVNAKQFSCFFFGLARRIASKSHLQPFSEVGNLNDSITNKFVSIIRSARISGGMCCRDCEISVTYKLFRDRCILL